MLILTDDQSVNSNFPSTTIPIRLMDRGPAAAMCYRNYKQSHRKQWEKAAERDGEKPEHTAHLQFDESSRDDDEEKTQHVGLVHQLC